MTDLTLVTYRDLAAAWRLSPRTIQNWVSQDEKAGIRVPRWRRRRGTQWGPVYLRQSVALALLRRHAPELFELAERIMEPPA